MPALGARGLGGRALRAGCSPRGPRWWRWSPARRGGRRRSLALGGRASSSPPSPASALLRQAQVDRGPGHPRWPTSGAAVERRAGGDLRPAADPRLRATGSWSGSRVVRGDRPGRDPPAPRSRRWCSATRLGRRTASGRGCGSPVGSPARPTAPTGGGRCSRLVRPGARRRARRLVARGRGGTGVAARRRSATGRTTSGRWCRRWWWATTATSTHALAEDFRATGLTHLLAVSGHQPDPGRRASCWSPGGGAASGAAATTSWVRSASSASCCSPAPSRAWSGPPRWATVAPGRDGRRRPPPRSAGARGRGRGAAAARPGRSR